MPGLEDFHTEKLASTDFNPENEIYANWKGMNGLFIAMQPMEILYKNDTFELQTSGSSSTETIHILYMNISQNAPNISLGS